MKMIIKTNNHNVKLWVQPENKEESRAISKVATRFYTDTRKDKGGIPYLEIVFWNPPGSRQGERAAARELINILTIFLKSET